MPAALAALTYLTTLNLEENALLKGSFPEAILAPMKSLATLRLGTGLSGTLPDISKNIPTLKDLQLRGGGWTGTIPAGYWAGSVLRLLHIHDTRLTGSVPALDGLGEATEVVIANNVNMRGNVPSVDPLRKVVTLNFYRNGFSGTMPSLEKLGALKTLQVSRNSLTGTFPELTSGPVETVAFCCNAFADFAPLWQTPPPSSLKLVEGYENLLTGTFPCHIVQFPAGERLRMEKNFFTGTIPCLDNFRALTELRLTQNAFVGTLPPTTRPNAVEVLELAQNQIEGTIPQGFVDAMVSLKKLSLSGNQFTGTLPTFTMNYVLSELRLSKLGKWRKVAPVVTSDPSFTAVAMDGSLGADVVYPARTKLLLDFGRNVCIDGAVVSLSKTKAVGGNIRRTAEGAVLDLRLYQGNKGFDSASIVEPSLRNTNGNSHHWSYSVPGGEKRLGQNVYSRHFYDWHPTCRVKTRYYGVWFDSCEPSPCKLTELTLYETEKMSGTVPDLSALKALTLLDLSKNALSGTVPHLVTGAWTQWIDLSDNLLEALPNSSFCPQFEKIKRVSLHHNRLTGTLPSLECARLLETVEVGNNPWSGTIPALPLGLKTLKRVYVDATACCPYGDWMSTWLETNTRNYYRHGTFCTRCGTGIVGTLPDFSYHEALFEADFGSNSLSGALEKVPHLTRIETFSIRGNFIAGTLPWKQIIEVGAQNSSCYVNSWWLTNNSFWGEVPDLVQPLATRTCPIHIPGSRRCICGETTHTNDGRKMYDVSFDENYLWGPLPSNLERSQGAIRVRRNCWDCPLPATRVYAPTCGTYPCLYDSKVNTQSSPIPTHLSAWNSVKSLSSPPDCSKGETYPLSGPSCVAPEPPGALYEFVARCQTETTLTRFEISEEELRGGTDLSLAAVFVDGASLPFFAPGVFECGGGVGATPWGPNPVAFTQMLRKEIVDSFVSDKSEAFGFAARRDILLGLGAASLILEEMNPYVGLPNALNVVPSMDSRFDISSEEHISFVLPGPMFLAPFGSGELFNFTIVPSPGMLVVPDDIVTNELDVRDGGVVFGAGLHYGETFACTASDAALVQCITFDGFNITEDSLNMTYDTQKKVSRTRTCGFSCAFPTASVRVVCTPQTLSFVVVLPDYELSQIQTESFSVHLTASCTSSGLLPQNTTDAPLGVTIESEVEPTASYTLSLSASHTATETRSVTARYTMTETVTASESVTPDALPLCVAFPESVFCVEGGVGLRAGSLPVAGVLVALGCVAVAVMLLCARLCRKKRASFAPVACEVLPVSINTLHPPTPPDAGITVQVRAGSEAGITVQARAGPEAKQHLLTDIVISGRKC